MNELLLGVAIVVALVMLDFLALRFGVDSRRGSRRDAWW